MLKLPGKVDREVDIVTIDTQSSGGLTLGYKETDRSTDAFSGYFETCI